MLHAAFDWLHANLATIALFWLIGGTFASVVAKHTAEWPRVQRVANFVASCCLDFLKACQQFQGGGSSQGGAGTGAPPATAPKPPSPDEPLPPTLRRASLWRRLTMAIAGACLCACSWLTPEHVDDVVDGGKVVLCVIANRHATPAQILTTCKGATEDLVRDVLAEQQKAAREDLAQGYLK